MLGVGDALEESVGGAEYGEGHFWAVDEGSEAFVMALAGFTEKDGFDAASGAESFFDEADAFDAYGAGFGGQAATQRHAKEFEPAIVAASERAVGGRGASGTRGFGGRRHAR